MKIHTFIWLGILIASLIGGIFLIKIAYANPLNLPDYAFTNPQIKEAYLYAKLNASNLDGLPCNCGCMDAANAASHGGRVHSRGLIDCFMKGDVNNGGIWDQHASECGMCYEDALYAKKLYEQGKSKEEVKSALLAKYATQVVSNSTVYGGSK